VKWGRGRGVCWEKNVGKLDDGEREELMVKDGGELPGLLGVCVKGWWRRG
jgi:hypothetical protein